MKPRNKTVELEMQGTRGLPSDSFIKQALPVYYWIDLFDDKNCISLFRGTQREYSSKPHKHSIVERTLVFKR